MPSRSEVTQHYYWENDSCFLFQDLIFNPIYTMISPIVVANVLFIKLCLTEVNHMQFYSSEVDQHCQVLHLGR